MSRTAYRAPQLSDQMGAVRARRVKQAVDAVGKQGTVDLSGIQLETDGAAMAAAALTRHRDSVTILAADGCALSGAGAARLGKWAMTVSSLKELSLSDNPAMGDRGARAMADLVATHPKLHTLRLGATSMTDEGAVEIASALRSSSSLRVLSLGSNCLGADGIAALVSALDVNRSLTELFLGDPTTWSGGVSDGLVPWALRARLKCQRNEAALLAIRPRQALAWASTAISRSSPAFVLPTDLLEMVAALFVEQHDEDKTASLHRDAVLARCCAPVLPEDGSETPFADDATAASATAAAAAPVAGGRAPGAAAGGGDTRGEAGAGDDDLLAWVSAQEAS